ncbi:MAG: DUF4442 domain-containing protein [Gammaproteobacteria bacterium]|nr:DUF4442 domain-containing protein [Gammaproteobacteria bacterium]NNM01154.1 DUF4442 domain-containing protein [Gammaproteobacteria bacterium]
MSVARRLRNNWERLSGLPGGKRLFSIMLGRMAPYTGTVGGVVELLEPGHARVRLRDRHRVRNHLQSVHAIALANIAEMSTGLAVLSGLPDDARAILVGFSIEYVKKARGDLIAETHCEIPATTERRIYEIEGVIRDASGEVVANAVARWLIGTESAARAA